MGDFNSVYGIYCSVFVATISGVYGAIHRMHHVLHHLRPQLEKALISGDVGLQNRSGSGCVLPMYVATSILLPVFLAFITRLWWVAPLVLLVFLLWPHWQAARVLRRRRQQLECALPDALSQLASAIRAGSTFSMAVNAYVEENEGPLSVEWSIMLNEQRLGSPWNQALDDLGARVDSEEMTLVIAAIIVAHDVGGQLADVLQRLSRLIRRKLEMEGKIKALTSQGIMQGRVVAGLPFLLLVALLLIEPTATRAMFTGLLGWLCLSAIVLLQSVGAMCIRRIVRIRL